MHADRADGERLDATRVARRPETRNGPAERPVDGHLLGLQDLAGNRAVTHLLTDKPAPAGPEPVHVQRRVGFEFEDMHWAAWRHHRDDGVDRGVRSLLPRGIRKRTARNEGGDLVETVKRKEVLHRGPGYRIEGEDSAADRGATSIEVVTDAFEETEAGISSLERAMQDLNGQVARLDTYAGRPGPAIQPGRDTYPLTELAYLQDYVRPSQHKLSGSPGLRAKDILLSGGTRGLAIKMQYTAGLRLRDLPGVLETVGYVMHESDADADARQHVRQHLYRPDQVTDPVARVGAAPGKARQLFRALREHRTYSRPLKEDRADLLGFLSALVMTVDLLQATAEVRGNDELVKFRLGQMPRNNFVQMLDALPPAQRGAIQADPTTLARELVAVVDPDLRPNSPLIPPNRVLDGNEAAEDAGAALETLGIDRWIHGLVTGTDFLTTPGMQRWLRGRHVTDTARADAANALSSIGALESVDTRADPSGGAQQLFQFENRALDPARDAAGVLTMSLAAQHAVEILRYFAAVRRGG